MTTRNVGGLTDPFVGLASSDSMLSIALAYDNSQRLEYKGRAPAGTAKSAAHWQIQRYFWDATSNLVDILWANGNGAMDQVWDDRASLTYS